MKPFYKKKKSKRKKRNPNSIYLALKDAYSEARLDEYLRTGISSQMTFTNFLIMYMKHQKSPSAIGGGNIGLKNKKIIIIS